MKTKASNKKTVLFVCTGNTCRSPMAEQIFNCFLKKKGLSAQYKATSAGVNADKGGTMNELAVAALINLGIKPKKHRCRQFTRSKAAGADIVICMSKSHRDHIIEEFELGGEASGNVCCFSQITGAFDVPDPFGSDIDKYISCANYLNYACEDILNLITK